jgi:hypothetical protein
MNLVHAGHELSLMCCVNIKLRVDFVRTIFYIEYLQNSQHIFVRIFLSESENFVTEVI